MTNSLASSPLPEVSDLINARHNHGTQLYAAAATFEKTVAPLSEDRVRTHPEWYVLGQLAAAEAQLEEFRRAYVALLRLRGVSWAYIAEHSGVSRQAAHKRYAATSPAPDLGTYCLARDDHGRRCTLEEDHSGEHFPSSGPWITELEPNETD